MTVKLYDSDSYIKEFTATVVDSYKKADGYFTILDATAFFPEAGGQGSDTGYLNDVKVYDVQIDNGIIYHYTTEAFNKGQVVTGRLDFERRFDFMQQHSAEHIVSGIANRLFGCENVGFHLGEDIVTFDFDKFLTPEQLLKIEELANEAVFSNKPFRTYYPDAKALETLSYRSKGELEGEVRIVEIEDTDICACCAPHVKFAGEIGIIKLLHTERLRGGIRIELKAGSRALNDYRIKNDNTYNISKLLCVKQEETASAVDRLLTQISELKYSLNGIKKQIIDQKVESFNSENEVTAIFEPELDVKALQGFADALYKKASGIRAVFSENDNGFAFAMCGKAERLDCLFAEFKKKFSVRGGGRNGMVQGTVFAVREELERFFKG